MTMNPKPDQDGMAAMLQKLSASARRVAQGDYDAARHFFQVTGSEAETPELRELAETLGLMSVKVEWREYHLEQLLAELKKKHAELESIAALRAESGFFFCSVVFLMSIYSVAVSGLPAAGYTGERIQTVVTAGMIAVLMAFAGIFARRHRYPWASWGLTWQGGARALRESLLLGIPVALAGIAFKWILAKIPASPFFGSPVFESLALSGLEMVLYAFGVIAQEIIARGFMQASLARVLVGKYRVPAAIATASLLFAIAHLHYYSFFALLATLAGGFFFGWLFHRHGTLVGVCVIHFLLGLLIYFLGLI